VRAFGAIASGNNISRPMKPRPLARRGQPAPPSLTALLHRHAIVPFKSGGHLRTVGARGLSRRQGSALPPAKTGIKDTAARPPGASPYQAGPCEGHSTTLTIINCPKGFAERGRPPLFPAMRTADSPVARMARQPGGHLYHLGKASRIAARQARRANVAGSRWADAVHRPASRCCPRPCGVGSATVHGRARERRSG
jgi:hypothetical protein